MNRFPPQNNSRGFTLIELLTTIFLISLVLGLTFPTLRATVRSSSVDMAIGQINSGVSAARVFATRDRPFLVARRVGASIRTASANGDGFSGAICLFTPAGALRVLENDENARDNGLPNADGWLEMQFPPLNGYRPIDGLDEIRMPGRVQTLGIVRTGSGNYDVQLVPPPFAIRFSSAGTLSLGQESPASTDPFRYVFVSPREEIGTSSGTTADSFTQSVLLYDVSEDRGNAGATVDLDLFGRGGTERTGTGRIALPFSAVETVSGVLVIDPDQVPEEFAHPNGMTGPVPLNFREDRIQPYSVDESAALLSWAVDAAAGRVMLFNRTTGQDLTR